MENMSIGRLVSILHRQSQLYLNIALKDINICTSEYLFMITLLKEDGISQENLSDKILIDKAATARAVKSLEEKGFVIRVMDDHDKRVKKVYCTQKARESQAHICTALTNWTKLLTEDLEEDTEKILIDTLERMSDKVRNINFNDLLQKE